MTATDSLLLRVAQPEDEPAILDLVGSVMGWGGDSQAAAMWHWKHVDNPAGRSPTWVAVEDGRIVGVRVFLRWRFDSPGGARSAVRAVDTVTHPDHRGRGLFKRLTLLGLEELKSQGVDFVFNTPNDQSLPGYLSMGWKPVRRLSVVVRPDGLAGVVAMARNRVPAELDSLPCDVGHPAADGLDDACVAALAASPTEGVWTARTESYLRWRYAGLTALCYRVLSLSADAAEGVAVLRLRRRGTALEATVAELSAPDRASAGRLLRTILQSSGASYALSMTAARGGVKVPRLGPLLVARPVAAKAPDVGEWRLSLGDVELF